eukprot:TRINITY_DN13271_c0_g1_i1.p1 TRINITY_DN13271_c0_g1~~TRINITY_DN13271_c0_g1_i1.p1  ORF type:complete len:142 (-),score=16.62 TRINITY_DN13271_c0_g1_i1:414-839(-)
MPVSSMTAPPVFGRLSLFNRGCSAGEKSNTGLSIGDSVAKWTWFSSFRSSLTTPSSSSQAKQTSVPATQSSSPTIRVASPKKMVAIDEITSVPEDLFRDLLAAADEVDFRGQHRVVRQAGRRGSRLVRNSVEPGCEAVVQV